ncbi:MAG: TfoX/Sxy family protein [Acidobacteriota bacterium]
MGKETPGATALAKALRNIGPTSARWLLAIGVESLHDLETIGSAEAFRRVRAAGFSANLNLLYALQGALIDAHWSELPAELKAKLRAEVDE